jgi:hypothetical protein
LIVLIDKGYKEQYPFVAAAIKDTVRPLSSFSFLSFSFLFLTCWIQIYSSCAYVNIWITFLQVQEILDDVAEIDPSSIDQTFAALLEQQANTLRATILGLTHAARLASGAQPPDGAVDGLRY